LYFIALLIYLYVVVKERAEPSCQPVKAGHPSGKVFYQVVGVTGFEPVTLRLSSACSNQLSYTPVIFGGAEESRTPDL
jgi:hypothetical protein